MRNKSITWAAAALMLLAGLSGCQKSDYSGKEIRFNARSLPEIGTKAVYTGDKNDNNFERINWEVGDKIRIYNDVATCSGDPNYYWADYTVGSVASSSNRYSTGQLNVSSSRGGLTWGTNTHTFYGVYPSPETNDAAGTQDLSAFTGSIQQTQTGEPSGIGAWTGTGEVYYPSNNKPILVGYKQLEAGETGTLDFSPAYSAFHISAGVQENMTVKSVELRSASHKLWGNFTVSRSGSAWSFDGLSVSDPADKTVTFTLPGSGVDITTSDILELVLFTLPQDLDDLTLAFKVTVGGTPKTLTLELKRSDSSPVTFNACKKSYIKGLLIPGATWTINGSTTIKLRELVGDWDDPASNGSVNYGDTQVPPVFNATGLNQYGTDDKEFDFSIFAPKGGTWKVTAVDALTGSTTADSKLVILTQEGGTTTSPDGVLSGTIGTANAGATSATWIHFTATSGPAGSYALKFSVELNGVTYSIDSEVIRNGFGSGDGQYKVFTF